MSQSYETILESYKNGNIDGNELSRLMKENIISKAERRKIVKSHKKFSKLSDRQKLRMETKEKKKLPKLTREERVRKFQQGRIDERNRKNAEFTICLGCRKKGHLMKDCPEYKRIERNNMCFNCGEFTHTLKNCPQPRSNDGFLKFANCFICNQSGHLSRDCPQNTNGLYPQGGCCHICQSKAHLAKDCPEKPKKEEETFKISSFKDPYENDDNIGDEYLLDNEKIKKNKRKHERF